MPNPVKAAYKSRREVLEALEACLESDSCATIVKACSQLVKLAELDVPFEKQKRIPGQRYTYNMRAHAIRIVKKKVLAKLKEVMSAGSKSTAVDAATLMIKIAGPSRDVQAIAPLERQSFDAATETT